MQQISSFFDKIRNIIKDDSDIKEIVCHILGEHIGQGVSPDRVTLKEGVITVSGSPAFKNEVALRKQKLLEEIKNALPKGKHFSDLR